jgi:hypothetical protein
MRLPADLIAHHPALRKTMSLHLTMWGFRIATKIADGVDILWQPEGKKEVGRDHQQGFNPTRRIFIWHRHAKQDLLIAHLAG